MRVSSFKFQVSSWLLRSVLLAAVCLLLPAPYVYAQHGQANLASSTVAGLPAASSVSNFTYIVTDSATGCTVGGGTAYVMCKSNGTIWKVVGSGISGSGTDTHLPVFTGPTTLGDSPVTWDGTDIKALPPAGRVILGDFSAG